MAQGCHHCSRWRRKGLPFFLLCLLLPTTTLGITEKKGKNGDNVGLDALFAYDGEVNIGEFLFRNALLFCGRQRWKKLVLLFLCIIHVSPHVVSLLRNVYRVKMGDFNDR